MTPTASQKASATKASAKKASKAKVPAKRDLTSFKSTCTVTLPLTQEKYSRLIGGSRVVLFEDESNALQVKELETDNANMRQFGKEKQNQVVMLEQKVASLETVVDDMTRRAKDLAAENARVASERDALAENVKKLTRDLKRLGAVRQPQPSQLGAWTDSVGAV